MNECNFIMGINTWKCNYFSEMIELQSWRDLKNHLIHIPQLRTKESGAQDDKMTCSTSASRLVLKPELELRSS